MLQFPTWQKIAIITICALGVIFSVPSFLPKAWLAQLPTALPIQTINLGLDLRGGSHLLLEVDTAAVTREKLLNMQEDVRATLRTEKIGYSGLDIRDNAVTLQIRDAADVARARTALGDIANRAVPTGTGIAAANVPAAELKVEADNRFTLVPTEAAILARTSGAVDQTLEIVRRRIDQTGVAESSIQRQGKSRILVQLPGVDEPDRIVRLLGTTAKMTFQMVDDSVDLTQPAPPGIEILPMDDPRFPGQKVAVRKKIEVAGESLVDSQPGFDQRSNEPIVTFRFDVEGGRRFADVTRINVGKRFAIVLDRKVISAPVIQTAILGGSGQISGNFTIQSASELAVLLRAGALPAPLKVVEQRTVGPELGADAIRAGIISISAGFILVIGYMGAAYGRFGNYANVALFFNLALTIAMLAMLQATLTLPGIAGLLLTLGMSVDANVLINERIREETLNGAGPARSIESGFTKAFSTIVDANLTTLIKMAILFLLGTGAVKGFAVTISLGILTSMFTATLVVRYMVAHWYATHRPKDLRTEGTKFRLRFVPDKTTISFMNARNFGLGFSAFLSLASVVLLFQPGLNQGIDFKGGIVMEVRTPQPADFPQLRQVLADDGIAQARLQEFGSPNDVLIRLERQPGEDADQQKIVEKLRIHLQEKVPGLEVRRTDVVGASVSAELFSNGMIAMTLAIVAMLIYIWFRFEWQFGIGAVATLVLDVTKTLGFYAITGFEFNLVSIAAILTIMGWSVNDKVVVYDRMRENLRRFKSMPLRDLIDLSINETLNRTINTSVTILLATLPLALFGGEALEEFAIVMLFGIALATSSSIFIAAPILLLLGEKSLRPGIKQEILPPEGADGPAPGGATAA